MKDSFWYPIVFTLIMVIIFAGILSVMYRLSAGKIEREQLDNYQQAVLRTLAPAIAEATAQSPKEVMAAYPTSFEQYVHEAEIAGFERRIFEATVNDSVIAYAFEIGGKGLWGSMQALVSTGIDLRSILDFNIVMQQETPGLGARIEEKWFLAQFSGREFVVNPESIEDVTQSYEFISETAKPENDRQLRRVTGATITSDAVIKMLRDEFNYIYAFFRNNEL